MTDFKFDPFPVLYTNRLKLVRISEEDIDDLFGLRSHKSVMKYIGRPLARTVEDARKLFKVLDTALKENSGITWGIKLKDDNKLYGTIGYWQLQQENKRAEIGYLLATALQGKGLMQEALIKVLDHGFHKMQLHSVEANVNPENMASIRLLEKNKFIKEGHLRENYFFDGKYFDTAVYSLLKQDFINYVSA